MSFAKIKLNKSKRLEAHIFRQGFLVEIVETERENARELLKKIKEWGFEWE